MKKFLLPLIALLIVESSVAQVAYESPHVKDGMTFQLELPDGYFGIDGSDMGGGVLYTTKEGIHYNQVNKERESLGILAVFYEPKDDRMFQDIVDEFQTSIINSSPELKTIAALKTSKLNGRDCVNAAFKGEMDGEMMSGFYFSITMFGDYHVGLAYYATEGVENTLSYENFKKIMLSWKDVETTKEDLMSTDTIYFEEDAVEVIEEPTNYLNDMFETKLSFHDILPQTEEGWYHPLNENGHLISEFVFPKYEGSIKVFSGGSAANYPGPSEMSIAIKLAISLPGRLVLSFDSQISGEDHEFNKYSVTGGGSHSCVYTTVVDDELVFFVIDEGSYPRLDFNESVHEFMSTMWIVEDGAIDY